jgi:hypothetical protein
MQSIPNLFEPFISRMANEGELLTLAPIHYKQLYFSYLVTDLTQLERLRVVTSFYTAS